MLPSLAPSNNPPDKPDPFPSSPPSIILTETTDTLIQNHTAYTSMIPNSIIVAEPDPHLIPSTGSLPSHIVSSWPSASTSVSPTDIPSKVMPTYPSLAQSLLPCADKKYFPVLHKVVHHLLTSYMYSTHLPSA